VELTSEVDVMKARQLSSPPWMVVPVGKAISG
jgi:hypothetical protein